MSKAFGKFYSYVGNYRADKCIVTSKYAGLELDVVNVTMGKENKSPDYLKKFPLGKVPGFEGADGYLLTESSAICFYLCANAKKECNLTSKDPKTMASIMKWVFLSDSDMSFMMYSILYLKMGSTPSAADTTENKALTMFKNTLSGVDNSIAKTGTKFLVADHITLADVCMFGVFYTFYCMMFTEALTKKYHHIDTWFKNVMSDSIVSSVYKCDFTLGANDQYSNVISFLCE